MLLAGVDSRRTEYYSPDGTPERGFTKREKDALCNSVLPDSPLLLHAASSRMVYSNTGPTLSHLWSLLNDMTSVAFNLGSRHATLQLRLHGDHFARHPKQVE